MLVYRPGQTLVRHVDGYGGWLVLFSFGNTVRFFVNDRAVVFESGDALAFKGATVMHGVDETLGYATYKGRRCELGLAGLKGVRVSVQARQG